VLLFRLDGADWKKLAINPVLLRVRQRSQSISHSTLPETADNVVLRRQVRRLAQLLIHSWINHPSSGDLRAFPENEGAPMGGFYEQTRPISRLPSIPICLLLLQNLSLAARKVELTLPWSELESHIGQRKIALVLPDGVHLMRKVMDITSDALVLNVMKSSDPKGHPKGKPP